MPRKKSQNFDHANCKKLVFQVGKSFSFEAFCIQLQDFESYEIQYFAL